ERLIIALSSVAAMEGILEMTVAYTKERALFGTRLDTFQNTRYVLADLQTKTRIHRSFVKECMELIIEGKLDTATATMAKLACTEAQGEGGDKCLRLFGGYGYMTEDPISRA